MSIRTILTGEDEPVLHKVCHPVTSFDQKLADLLDDMKETLAKANGVGLAAPQVGILRRAVIVVNDQDEMLELVNPEILAQEGEQELSLIHISGRPTPSARSAVTSTSPATWWTSKPRSRRSGSRSRTLSKEAGG